MPNTLEQVIQSHLENYRHWLKPQNSSAFNDSLRLYISSMQKAPRDTIAISKHIAKLKEELSVSQNVFSDQRLLIKLEALETLRSLLSRHAY